MKRVYLSLFMIMSLLLTCVAVFPAEVLAATDVSYLDETGVEKIASTGTEITETTDTLTTGWYVVNADVTRAESIVVTGDAHLILVDGYTLGVTGNGGKAAINVSEGNSLTIYGQENATGKLVANCGYLANGNVGIAAIGGGIEENAGIITINGGHIIAKSFGFGAGIGGGSYGHCGVIAINGGTVDSVCLKITDIGTRGYGAGIGSGRRVGMKDDTNKKGVNNGKIVINGGNIRATSNVGAGIGGGFSSDGGEITINGGTIYARSVGDSFYDFGSGAGIGGGCGFRQQYSYTKAIGGDGGNITITGGTITAKSERSGTGIGGGGVETLGGGDPVLGGSGGNINISGGTINAMGSRGAAGIGGGREGDGGNVHITGGTVFANSRETNINDIGGGRQYPTTDGTLTISGPSAVFLRNNKSSQPVNTSSHYHKTFANATEVDDYTVPPNLPYPPGLTNLPEQPKWDSEFGSWLKGELYTISFDSEGGSPVDSITQAEKTTITVPKDPIREGYTFVKWDKEIPETMPSKDMTLIAQWKVNKYTITFDSDGGSEVPDITLDYGATITAPPNPTREGYTFDGWDKKMPVTMPSEDIILTAKWKKANKYRLIFDSAGGSPIDSITQAEETTIAAPKDPIREGYTFVKWDKEIPKKMPSKDMTLIAQWKVNKYTITFDSDGGSEVPDITLDYGATITAPEDPTREGYTFDGWNLTLPETMPNNDLEVVAKWTIIKESEPKDPTDPKDPVEPSDSKEPIDTEDPISKDKPVDSEKSKLLKTGSLPSTLFYGLGGLLILIGLIVRKKKTFAK